MHPYMRKLAALPLLLALSHNAIALAIVCSDEPVAPLDASASNERVIWSYYDYWYSAIFNVGETLVEQAVPALNAYSDASLFSRMDEEFRVAGYPADWGMDSYLNVGCVGTDAIDSEDAQEPPVPGDTGAETLIL